MIEATYLTPGEKRVQHVSEGSMAVLQIATLSSGSAILFFHSQVSPFITHQNRLDPSYSQNCAALIYFAATRLLP
jgi:hypothetical protein